MEHQPDKLRPKEEKGEELKHNQNRKKRRESSAEYCDRDGAISGRMIGSICTSSRIRENYIRWRWEHLKSGPDLVRETFDLRPLCELAVALVIFDSTWNQMKFSFEPVVKGMS